MKKILYPFIVLSTVGLVLSVIVHASALLKLELGLGDSTYILHSGIFVVWCPAVLTANRFVSSFKFNRKDFWKIVLQGCPQWMRNMTYVFFAYAFINFFIFFMFNVANEVSGNLEPAKLDVLRGFSGHWMAFYSAALSILYSAYQKWDSIGVIRRCQNGHEVSAISNSVMNVACRLIRWNRVMFSIGAMCEKRF